MIHADTFLLGIHGKRPMKAFGNPNFKLSGILIVRRFIDFDAFGNGGLKPLIFRIKGIGKSAFRSVGGRNTPG